MRRDGGTGLLDIDRLERIERDRETIESVWSGLVVMNTIGLFGFLALSVIEYRSAGSVPIHEFVVERPFLGGPVWYNWLILAVLTVAIALLLLKSAQQLRPTVLVLGVVCFSGWMILASLAAIRSFLADRPRFAGRADLVAVVDTNFLINVGYTILFLAVLVPLARLTLSVFRRPEAALLVPVRGAARSWMSSLLGWPAHVPSVGLPRLIPFLMFATSALMFAAGFMLGLNNITWVLGANDRILGAARSGQPAEVGYTPEVLYALIPGNLLLSLIVIVLFTWLAGLIARRARARVRLSMTEALAHDRRPAVLFLRAFKDDQVALPRGSTSWLARLLEIGRGDKRLDHIVLEEGFPLGPVVALGRPGDPVPPYGAARDYFAHSDWQTAVARLCDEAGAIIFCLDDSEGVWWEFDHITSGPALAKTLFLVHPSAAGPTANSGLLAKIAQRAANGNAAHALFAVTDQASLLGSFLGSDGSPVRCAGRRASHRAYRVMVRAFIHGRRGPD